MPGRTVEVPGPTVVVPGPTFKVPGPTFEVPGPTVEVPGHTVEVLLLRYRGHQLGAQPTLFIFTQMSWVSKYVIIITNDSCKIPKCNKIQ